MQRGKYPEECSNFDTYKKLCTSVNMPYTVQESIFLDSALSEFANFEYDTDSLEVEFLEDSLAYWIQLLPVFPADTLRDDGVIIAHCYFRLLVKMRKLDNKILLRCCN